MWKGSLVFSSTRNLRMNSWNWDEKTLQVFACASHNQRIKDASNDFYSRLQVAVDFLFFQSHFLTHFSLSCLLVNRITTWTFYPCSGFQLVRKWFLMIFFPSFECLEIYFSFHSLFFTSAWKWKRLKCLSSFWIKEIIKSLVTKHGFVVEKKNMISLFELRPYFFHLRFLITLMCQCHLCERASFLQFRDFSPTHSLILSALPNHFLKQWRRAKRWRTKFLTISSR